MNKKFNTAADIFSRIIAKENIKIVYNNSKTAAFDPDSRTMYFPVWATENYTNMLFRIHEIGHALFTPSLTKGQSFHDMDMRSFVKSNKQYELSKFKDIWNTVEDVRIERLVSRKYPGVGSILATGHVSLMEMGFYGKTLKQEDVDAMNFRNRVLIKYRMGTKFAVPPKNKTESDFFDRLSAMTTVEECTQLTELMYQYMYPEKPKEAPKPERKPESRPAEEDSAEDLEKEGEMEPDQSPGDEQIEEAGDNQGSSEPSFEGDVDEAGDDQDEDSHGGSSSSDQPEDHEPEDESAGGSSGVEDEEGEEDAGDNKGSGSGADVDPNASSDQSSLAQQFDESMQTMLKQHIVQNAKVSIVVPTSTATLRDALVRRDSRFASRVPK